MRFVFFALLAFVLSNPGWSEMTSSPAEPATVESATYDADSGVVTVVFQNRSSLPITAHSVQLFAIGPDGASLGRGLSTDLISEIEDWIQPGARRSVSFQGIDFSGNADLIVLQPEVDAGILSDGSAFGDPEEVQSFQLGRLASALGSRELLVRLEALEGYENPELMTQELERLVNEARDAVAMRLSREAAAAAQRAEDLKTPEGRQRIVARGKEIDLVTRRTMYRQGNEQWVGQFVDRIRREPSRARYWYEMLLSLTRQQHETIVSNLGPEMTNRYMKELEATQ